MRSFLLLFLFGSVVQAQELRLESDLIVHPQQIKEVLEVAQARIVQTDRLSWAELEFVRPYRTRWSGVEVVGPFQLQFDSREVLQRRLGVTLKYESPELHVAQFDIDDVIERDLGGATVVIRVQGRCSPLRVRLPQTGWTLRGDLEWGVENGTLKARWSNFDFKVSKLVVPEIELGTCVGPRAVGESLREAMLDIARRPDEISRLLREGMLDWLQAQLTKMQAELLRPQDMLIKPDLSVQWQPIDLAQLLNGALRVKGAVVLPSKEARLVPRSIADIHQVDESSFVFPKDALPALVDAIHDNGNLQFRLQSTEIESFQTLIQSRFLQFFLWPDLFSFSKRSEFYFDVRTRRRPKLSSPDGSSEGLSYQVEAPLVINMWAPRPDYTAYVRYMDFTSPAAGQMRASVQDDLLNVSFVPSSLNIKAKANPEMLSLRSVNAWIATSLLSSRAQSYLEEKVFSVPLPKWSLSEGLEMGVRQIKLTPDSLQIPFAVKNSK